MDETTRRRLIGAIALFVLAYLIAALLPDRNPDLSELAEDSLAEPGSTPKVVVYDLNAPAQDAAKTSVPETQAGSSAAVPTRPVTPVLTLEPALRSAGTSLGWYVQLGSYATQASAQDAASASTLMQVHSSAIKRPVVEWRQGERLQVTVGFDAAGWQERVENGGFVG